MKFIYDSSDDYKDVSHSYYDLHRFNDESKDEIFFYGYRCSIDDKIKNIFKNYKRKIYYNWESPCSFYCSKDAVLSQLYFDEVYTLCPYTAKYINERYGNITKQIATPYTMRTTHEKFQQYISNLNDKTYDIIYQGGFYGSDHYEMFDCMKKYKYIVCSASPNSYSTHYNINTFEKMNLISKAKISLASNLLYLKQHQINFCKQNFPDYKDHEGLIHIDKGIAPQFKSRIIEAAFCKTLNLIKYDEWNVIEKWFEPNKEFIYYYDKNDLEQKIKDILENYGKYAIIIENAHKKVFKYCIDEQVKMIINKKSLHNE